MSKSGNAWAEWHNSIGVGDCSQKIGVSVKGICCDNGLLVADREHFIRHF
jgi:hypothetical protein